MTSFNPGQFNDQRFGEIFQDLQTYGEEGHERIVIKQDAEGNYYPATASEPRTLTWLKSFLSQPETEQAHAVGTFFLEFCKANEQRIAQTISRCQASCNILSECTPEQNQNDADQFVERITHPSPQSDTATEIIARNALAEADKERNRLVKQGQEQEEALINEGVAEKLRALTILQTNVQPIAPGLRNQVPSEEDTIYLTCADPSRQGTLVKIAAHRSVLDAVLPPPHLNRSASEIYSLSFDEEERFEDYSFNETNNELNLNESYSRTAVNIMLDFMYGIPRTYTAKNISDLLGALDLLKKLGAADHLTESCKATCLNLCRECPSLFLECLVSDTCQKYPDVFRMFFEAFMDDIDAVKMESTEPSKKVFFETVSRISKDTRNPLFQTLEGYCYERGFGVKKDPEQAAALYQKAANRKCPEAENLLADSYKDSFGVLKDKDIDKAFKLCKSAADKGYARAQYNVGGLYRFYTIKNLPKEVRKNRSKEYYQKAADQGNVDALNQLAKNSNNVGDNKEAARLYELAAKKGSVTAQLALATLHNKEYNRKSFSSDKAVAAKWYRLAANKGNAEAQRWLGNYYWLGKGGLKKDQHEALKWYQKAADQNDPEGQCGLGMCYKLGGGTQPNYIKARQWFEQAAQQNHSKAQFELGAMYEKGLGVGIDRERAKAYYTQAREQNYPGAADALDRLVH